MRTSRYAWGLSVAVVVAGCDSGEATGAYEPPSVETEDGRVFYTSEEVRVTWTLPPGATGTEATFLNIDGPYEPARHRVLFDTTGVNTTYFGTGEREREYAFYPSPDEPADRYLAYRLRSVGPDGTSEWTSTRSVHVRSLSRLTTFPVELDAVVEFAAREGGGYHSGTVTTAPLAFASAVAARGYDPSAVRVVRPVLGAVHHLGPEGADYRDFSRAVIGFVDGGDTADAYPADILADTYGVVPGDGARLTFYPYGGSHRNLVGPLLASQRVRLAYFLRDDVEVGQTHRVRLSFVVDVYVAP
ncbi:MAG TPA: hypothetical protein VF576_08075 [Rubricoccaceae bacterium]|jgi:hypothetical protein